MMNQLFEIPPLSEVTLENPAMLYLLAPLVALVLVSWIRGRRSWAPSLLRICTFATLALALAEPVHIKQTSSEELSVLLDASASVTSSGRLAFAERLLTYLDQSKADSAVVTLFGRDPASAPVTITRNTSARAAEGLLSQAIKRVDSGDTNLERALTTLGARSTTSSILLLSDGFETSGSAEQAAKALGASGVKIFPLTPDPYPFQLQALSLSSLYLPLQGNSGESVDARVAVRNGLQNNAKASLELYLDKEKLFSRVVEVGPGEEKLFVVPTPALQGGLKRVRAVLSPIGGGDSQRPAPEEAARWISVKERQKILILSGSKDDERVLASLSRAKGYATESLIGDGVFRIPTDFENYSVIVMNNIARRQVPPGFLDKLDPFVRAGGGLLLVGGDRSFGLGDYIATPLERLSPVKFVPPQTTKKRLNSAVILVIDKSRSMNEDDRIGAARRAALASIRSLKDDDLVGVIGFDATPFAVLRLAPVAEIRPVADDRIERLIAAGKTIMLPALALARQMLTSAEASRKHIIVLSDGEVGDPGPQYMEELQRMRAAGITLSTVALGVDADAPFLKLLSQSGQGAFYQAVDPSTLPEIFVQDIKITTGERTMKENQDFIVTPGPSGTVSTTLRRYPPLRGFVETVGKESAMIELVTTKDSVAFPILASWPVGDGKVTAFTSDANGRWSDRWVPWEGFPKYWGEIFETLRKKGASSKDVEFDLRARVNQRVIELDLSLFDSKLASGAQPGVFASVIDPGGEKRELGMTPGRRGRFLGTIANGRPGDYNIQLRYGNTALPPVVVSIPGTAFGERPGRGLDMLKLSHLAQATGGTLNPSVEQVSGARRSDESKRYLYLPLAFLAFLLVILEAFVREYRLLVFSSRIRKESTTTRSRRRSFDEPAATRV